MAVAIVRKQGRTNILEARDTRRDATRGAGRQLLRGNSGDGDRGLVHDVIQATPDSVADYLLRAARSTLCLPTS